jgi:hypothetical protein
MFSIIRFLLVACLWLVSFPLAILYHLLKPRSPKPKRPGLFDRRNWGG